MTYFGLNSFTEEKKSVNLKKNFLKESFNWIWANPYKTLEEKEKTAFDTFKWSLNVFSFAIFTEVQRKHPY